MVDNPGRRRFEILIDGEVAGFAAYQLRDDAIVFTHTEVDPAFQGKGIGSQLAAGALDRVRESGGKAVAKCAFIAAYVKQHPEYDDLLR